MNATLTRRRALGAIATSPLILSALNADARGARACGSRTFRFRQAHGAGRDLARQPYGRPTVAAAQTLDRIDFEQAIQIDYRPEQTVVGR